MVARFEPGDKGGGAGRSGAVPGGKRPWIIAMTRQAGTAGGAIRYYLNGQEAEGVPAVQSLLGGVSAGRISFRGDLAEVILYDTARTEEERRSVEAYPGGQIRHSASLEPGRDRRRVCRGRKVLLGLPARDPAGASPSSGPGVAPHLAGPVHPGQAGGRGASAGSAGGPAEADSPAHLQPGGSAAGTRGG